MTGLVPGNRRDIHGRNRAALFVLFAFVGASAFPFRVGRVMGYVVSRLGGADSSVVELTPLDTAKDSSGTSWRFVVVDSSATTARRRSDTLVLSAGPTCMRWTRSSCLLPWDLGGPSSNSQDFGGLGWGGLALRCAGAKGQYLGADLAGIRSIQYGVSYDDSSFWSRSEMELPAVEGRWSEDSGWLSLQDGYSGESWRLSRIGDGPLVGALDAAGAVSWIDIHPGDRWNWRRRIAWSDSGGNGLSPYMSGKGSDSVDVHWTALRRNSDQGRTGAWTFERRIGESIPETLLVDFESPFARVESRALHDVDLDVFVRGAAPSWYDGSLAVRTASWDGSTIARTCMGADTASRVYEYAAGSGVSRMTQTFHGRMSSADMMPWHGDTTLVMELLSVDRASDGKTSVQFRESGRVSVRSVGDLERFLSEGGTILSVRDIRGRSRAWQGRDPIGMLRATHGLVFFSSTAPDGRTYGFTLILP